MTATWIDCFWKLAWQFPNTSHDQCAKYGGGCQLRVPWTCILNSDFWLWYMAMELFKAAMDHGSMLPPSGLRGAFRAISCNFVTCSLKLVQMVLTYSKGYRHKQARRCPLLWGGFLTNHLEHLERIQAFESTDWRSEIVWHHLFESKRKRPSFALVDSDAGIPCPHNLVRISRASWAYLLFSNSTWTWTILDMTHLTSL